MLTIENQLAQELKVRPEQVHSAVALLDGGATVPFIARYRKEATGNLDDIQLRELEARLAYLREMQSRRDTIIQSITEQGKLTPDLHAALLQATTKQALEDLYLPYKPKRRTKGMIAREAGLEPLADLLLADPSRDPAVEGQAFVLKPDAIEGADFSTLQAVLDGVRDLLSERWAEDAGLLNLLREWLWLEASLQSRLAKGKDEHNPDVAKFRDYLDYEEPLSKVPSHRALAVFRGRALELLEVKINVPETQVPADSKAKPESLAMGRIAGYLKWRHQGRPADDLLRKSVDWTWKVKLSLSCERDLLTRLRESAEKVAIKVFADNLRDLLLAAPAGPRVVMGLDPGIRTGVKVAVVDATSKLVATHTVYPHEPRRDWDGAIHTLAQLCVTHGVNLIAIGNGTASRETDKLAADLIAQLAKLPQAQAIQKVVVSEAGASVYSASELASQEMPDVDVSLRGAASIARRLQDPLAELVKIDPKSIGVGQYQHDVNPFELSRSLDAVVQDCVNAVGVDLNTASVPLLSQVSGLSKHMAQSVVRWREGHGAFANRQQLLNVSGLGPKTFEQCAGFLRIRGGDNPLDMTGVHPESYPVVEQILKQTGQPIENLMGRADMLASLRPELFANEGVGVITVRDILKEMEKPGRDPRPAFAVARFNEGVDTVADLKPGMLLEGTVSNVAAFGAFVDLGVHQDGLIHVSQLSHKFISDAREVVKTGDIVKVKVLEVDLQRQRVSLTMKLDAAPVARSDNHRSDRPRGGGGAKPSFQDRAAPAASGSAMASAFAKLQGIQKNKT
jgi:protein Tex